MKNRLTKWICILLVLCLSVPAGLIPAKAATVNYVYEDGQDYDNIILNWGTRGENATFLSPNAVDFYADNRVTYGQLAALAGSTNTSNVPYSALYSELQELMESNHTTKTSYGELRYLFWFTDCEGSSYSDGFSELYLAKSLPAKWDSSAFNREHCWPKSKTATPSIDNDDVGEATDLMTLRPSDPSTNTSRSNKAYGNTTSGSYFFPNEKLTGYDIRGDMARTLLYTYVRWGNTSYMWGSSGVIESREVLLDWIEEDPVDTWELGRNDSVESVTGTRNVFIDYPELAFVLFGEAVPSGMTTPSGSASEPAETYSVTAVANNSAWGTVSVTKNTVTATPAEGYRVAGYTVISGTAAVLQTENTFAVSPSSDCVIRIDFAELPVYAAMFTQNGEIISMAEAREGESIILPDYDGFVPEDMRFAGWVTEAVAETQTRPANIYTSGTRYSMAEDVIFYALYSRQDEEGTGGSDFALYTGEIAEGDYLITSNGGAMQAADADNSGRIDYAEIEIQGDGVVTEDASLVWHIAPAGDGCYTLYNEAAGVYAASTGAKNKSTLLSTVTDNAKWTVTGTETYDFQNLVNANKGINSILRRNGAYGFACYSSSTGSPLTLYQRGSGSVTYTTAVESEKYVVTFCDYDGTVLSSAQYGLGATVAVPADPVRASDQRCSYTFAGWTPEVTRVTGEATYTATYTETKIAYTVTFVDHDGTVLSTGTYYYGDTVVAPGAPTRESDDSYAYEFAGWSADIATVSGNTTYTAVYTETAHTWNAGVYTEPTTESDGYTTYTCTGCGRTKVTVDEGSAIIPAAITRHPEAATADSGNTVNFSIAAQGGIVKYQWQYRKLYKWFNTSMTGYNTDTLTVSATGARNGYDYRCMVTFTDGTVLYSEPAELTVRTYMSITYHPNDQIVVLGYKGQFTAAAEGEGIKYQWQYQRPGSELWIDTAMEGATKATVMIETTAARNGYKYRCRITDVTGNEQFTEAATMYVLSFTSHPMEAFSPTDGTVQFTVSASVSEGFTYQWQYRRSATGSWTNTTLSGYNTDTLTVPAKGKNGYEYRCVLTGSKNTTIASKGATLHSGNPVVFTKQPVSVSVKTGADAVFTVEATNVYAYQWQYRKKGSTTWYTTTATGNQSAQLTIPATANKNGYQYRCIVYGLDGLEYRSNIVTLVVSG